MSPRPLLFCALILPGCYRLGWEVDEVCHGEGCPETCESDADMCARLEFGCGEHTGVDNCGASRTIACGACLVVEPVYRAAGSDWNDHVRVTVAGAAPYHQTDLACSGNEAELHQCVHGGELRKVAITGTASCSGLTLVDSLAAFTWECDDSDGTATFFSTHLQPGRGLRDLITGLAFVPLHVEVTGAGEPRASAPEVWWENPFRSLDEPDLDNQPGGVPQPVELSEEGTIYVLPAERLTAGYVVTAPRVAVVTQAGPLRWSSDWNSTSSSNCNDSTGLFESPDTECGLAVAPGAHFYWLEVALGVEAPLDPLGRGILVRDSHFGRIWNSQVVRPAGYPVYMGGDHAIVAGTHLHQGERSLFAAGRGLRVVRSHAASGGAGFATFFATESVIVASFATFSPLGFELHGATCVACTAPNNDGVGVEIGYGGPTTMLNVVVANAGRGFSDENVDTTFAQIVAVHTTHGIFLTSTSAGSRFYGNLLLGDASDDTCCTERDAADGVCEARTGHDDGIDGACAPQASSSFVVTPTPSVALSFLGSVSDSDNADGATGHSVAADEVSDWFAFEDISRAWGLEGAFPGDETRDQCRYDLPCHIWDASLAPGETVLTNHTGDGSSANDPFVAGATCPAEVDGDVTATNALGQVYLLNAVERMLDHRGDEDGLCESDEPCIYTPTFGADQGTIFGRVGGTCTFVDGAVSGVRMFEAL